MGGWAQRCVVCRVAVLVGMAAGRARAASAHWLGGQVCWGGWRRVDQAGRARYGAGCPAAAIGCCR